MTVARDDAASRRAPGSTQGDDTLQSEPLSSRFSTPGAERTSQIIRTIAEDRREQVTIRQVLATLGGRSYGGLFVLLSVLSPLPGIGVATAALMLMLGLQLAFGRPYPYCPARLADHRFRPEAMRRTLRRLVPLIVFAEHFVRPRYDRLTRRPFDLVIGFVVSLLSVVLILPVPLLNMLPSLAVFVVALALLERDGLAMLLGMVLAVATFLVLDLILVAGTSTLVNLWG